jgi:hypothetical protein
MNNNATLAQIRANQLDTTRNSHLQEYFDVADRYMEIVVDFLFRIPETETRTDRVLLKAAIASLGASIINQLEAARLSLSAGLLQPATVLFRSIYEAALLADYLAIHPQEVRRWTQGKEIRMATVRKGLTKLTRASEVYSVLSEMVHPNLAVVHPIVFNIKSTDKPDAAALGIVVGGSPSDNQVIACGQIYLSVCLFVTTILLPDIAEQFEPQGFWEELLERKNELDKQATDKWLRLSRTPASQ